MEGLLRVGIRSQAVECGSDKDRGVCTTEDAAALGQGMRVCDNAGAVRKMPFIYMHELKLRRFTAHVKVPGVEAEGEAEKFFLQYRLIG